MQKKLLLVLLLSSTLFASESEFLDDDIDGIENALDKCPNTPITDIVDKDGCSVEKLEVLKEHHFDLSIGFGYTNFDANTSQRAQSLSFSYYYGDNFSLSFYTSTYDLDSSESGIDDSTLSMNYMKSYENFYLLYGVGVYLPTFDIPENESDYFVRAKITKEIDNWDVSLQLQHTFMQDKGTEDTNLLSLSSGYTFNPSLYSSLSYTIQDSIYKNEGNLQNISLYGQYFINEYFFINSSLSIGLNSAATDSSYQISLGYSY